MYTYYLTVSVGQESVHSLTGFVDQGLSQTAIMELARGRVSSELWLEKDLLPSSHVCWPRFLAHRNYEMIIVCMELVNW